MRPWTQKHIEEVIANTHVRNPEIVADIVYKFLEDIFLTSDGNEFKDEFKSIQEQLLRELLYNSDDESVKLLEDKIYNAMRLFIETDTFGNRVRKIIDNYIGN